MGNKFKKIVFWVLCPGLVSVKISTKIFLKKKANSLAKHDKRDYLFFTVEEFFHTVLK
jgi:hypothetical protein